ncbi:hypothetical protein GPECTOR_102g48 [Gonium pectorale]|uniref:CCHC-type domain-containing protein n=1 Tax=Gonium pectorale TaxID=33097 RepID=A0A150G0X0_GONPE|nr:hypothetical protein GPECTOR_102g48 [Gonium pectorale]|eukprot:KXZ43095.1 hypothetical protein GPECTOR_102g48 [Gonium pectorale]
MDARRRWSVGFYLTVLRETSQGSTQLLQTTTPTSLRLPPQQPQQPQVAGVNPHAHKECYYCHQLGHIKPQCPLLASKQPQQQQAQQKPKYKPKPQQRKIPAQFALHASVGELAAEVADLYGPAWVLDSGAGRHMTPSFKDLNNPGFFPHGMGPLVKFGNGQSAQAQAVGTVEVVRRVDGEKKLIRITNVLFVPGLKRRLMSVKDLTDKGFCVSFQGDRASVAKDGLVYVTASLVLGSYIPGGLGHGQRDRG